MTSAGGILQALLELGHVVVRVAHALRPAEPDAVDDRRVVERVADHHVGLVEDGLEETSVGIEAGAVEDGVVGAEERRHPRLELFVHALRATDEAHRCHAEAVIVHSLRCGLHQRRMVGEAEVVVRAEIEDLAAV